MMDEIKEVELARLREEIRKSQQLIVELDDMFPDHLPVDWIAAWELNRYGVFMGYNPVMVLFVISALVEHGWNVINDELDMQEGERKVRFTRTGKMGNTISLTLFVNVYGAGSTCIKRQIGEEVVKKPIFEVVCKVGASEEVNAR